MKKESRSVAYLEKRVAALEAFYAAAMDYFNAASFCIDDVIDADVLEAVENTRPKTTEEIQRDMVDFIKSHMATLPVPVSLDQRDYIIKYIDAHQMTPYQTGGSLHIWEERYLIEEKRYSIWGEHGSNIIQGVDLLPDNVDK
jgi:hypothetical protein